MRDRRHEGAVERRRRWVNRKRRMAYRLRARAWGERLRPMFAARNIHYDLAEKDRGSGEGGIGAMHLLTRRVLGPDRNLVPAEGFAPVVR